MSSWPTDEEIQAAGWVRTSRRERRIQSSPRPKQYYWVDFPHDAYVPEFVEEHPGIVIRGGKLTHGTCIIVPVTSRPQSDERYVHRLSVNPNPQGRRDGVDAYAICEHIYTVNISRLRPVLNLRGDPIYPRVEEVDFKRICELIHLALFPSQPAIKDAVKPIETPNGALIEPQINPASGREILKLPNQKP